MSVIELLKEERKKQGVTLTQLADEIGSSHAHLSLVENRRCNVTLELLERIANALNVEIVIQEKV